MITTDTHKKHVTNTKVRNCCWFCYKNFNPANFGAFEETTLFLKLFERHSVDKSGKSGRATGHFDELLASPVSLTGYHNGGGDLSPGFCVCDDCRKVVRSFCEAYHRMKVAQLEVDWKLWTLTRLMTNADRVQGRVNNFKKFLNANLPNGREGKEEFLLVSRRAKLIRRCRWTLRRSFPRPVLRQCGDLVQTTAKISRPETDTSIIGQDSQSNISPSGEGHPDVQHHQQSLRECLRRHQLKQLASLEREATGDIEVVTLEETSSFKLMRKVADDVIRSKVSAPVTQSKVSAPVIRSKVSAPVIRSKVSSPPLSVGVVSDRDSPNNRENPTIREIALRYCSMVKKGGVNRQGLWAQPPLKCQHCSLRFWSQSQLTKHKFREHRAKLFESSRLPGSRLNEKQFENAMNRVLRRFTFYGTLCSICNRDFAQRKFRDQHVMEVHNERFLEELEAYQKSLTNSTPRRQKCEYCDISFQEARKRRMHEFRVHSGDLLAEYREETTSSADFKGGIKEVLKGLVKVVGGCKECLVCGRKYDRRSKCEYHVVQQHKDRFSRDLEAYLKRLPLSSTNSGCHDGGEEELVGVEREEDDDMMTIGEPFLFVDHTLSEQNGAFGLVKSENRRNTLGGDSESEAVLISTTRWEKVENDKKWSANHSYNFENVESLMDVDT